MKAYKLLWLADFKKKLAEAATQKEFYELIFFMLDAYVCPQVKDWSNDSLPGWQQSLSSRR